VAITQPTDVSANESSAGQIGAAVPCERLELALDSMVDKLKSFHDTLDSEEQAALMELLESAKTHTDSIQARNEGELAKLVYDKPIQVHATYAMKEKMKRLPEIIRESEGE